MYLNLSIGDTICIKNSQGVELHELLLLHPL